MDTNSIARTIKAHRTELGWTQQRAADEVNRAAATSSPDPQFPLGGGCQQSDISEYETGRSYPGPARTRNLIAALGLPEDFATCVTLEKLAAERAHLSGCSVTDAQRFVAESFRRTAELYA